MKNAFRSCTIKFSDRVMNRRGSCLLLSGVDRCPGTLDIGPSPGSKNFVMQPAFFILPDSLLCGCRVCQFSLPGQSVYTKVYFIPPGSGCPVHFTC